MNTYNCRICENVLVASKKGYFLVAIKDMDIVEFGRTIGELKRVKRSGWVRVGVPEPESVADHIFRLSALALVVANDLNVDQGKITKMALVHDLGESIVGDIVVDRGGKTIGSPEEKHLRERRAIEFILGGLKDGTELIALWDEFEHQESRESKVLKQLDRLEMVMTALEYEKEVDDKKKLDEFWESARKAIEEPLIRDWFKRLESSRSK